MDSTERDKQLKECYKRINESFERSRKRFQALQKSLDDITKRLNKQLNIIEKGYAGKFKDFKKLLKDSEK